MSIIERAAGKLGRTVPSAQPLPPIPGASAASSENDREHNLIEAAIDRTEASFIAREPLSRAVPPIDADFDDGPQTVLCSQQGSVNIAALKAMGVLTPDAGRSRIAEEFRLIKRPLLTNALGFGSTAPVRNGNLIMVTSAVPGEGKSFTAINLAISMATEMENTVLLVDADVTKSAIVRYLGLDADKGLLDVLRDPTIKLSDVLIKTDVAKLTVLPAGRTFAHATELLASNAMRAFVRDIASRYPDRVILFDCPPLLSTSEASVLASYMGQIVFVVEAEKTPQEAIKDALARISDCEHVGIVLNKVPEKTIGSDYYGYGYGEYGRPQ